MRVGPAHRSRRTSPVDCSQEAVVVECTRRQALAMRMASLLLRERPGGRPADVAGVVTWMGALQAQDLASGLWSFGVRLPRFTLDEVTAALERREAVRTWPMRGTVHFVPPCDVHWMLDLMGSRALAGAAKRRAFLGLSEEVADRAVEVLGAALAGGGRLTRAQCMAVLADKGIGTAGQLGYHLLWYASQREVLCIAPNIGTEQTFVLLDDWVPDPVPAGPGGGPGDRCPAVLPQPRADHPAGLRRLDRADRGRRAPRYRRRRRSAGHDTGGRHRDVPEPCCARQFAA